MKGTNETGIRCPKRGRKGGNKINIRNYIYNTNEHQWS
jgi:hypothetical protein